LPCVRRGGGTFWRLRHGIAAHWVPVGVAAYLKAPSVSVHGLTLPDAVRIFKDVKARKALAMHWGTWILTTEPVLEPPALLKNECEKAALGPDDLLVPVLGETVFF